MGLPLYTSRKYNAYAEQHNIIYMYVYLYENMYTQKLHLPFN